MCETLKDKIHEVQEGYPVGKPFVYLEVDDVASAVKGFAKEIDCMENKDCTIMRCDVEHLIVKWFPDVI